MREVFEENGALVWRVSIENLGDLAPGRPDHLFNWVLGVGHRLDDDLASVIRIGSPADESGSLQAVDQAGGCPGGETGTCGEFSRCERAFQRDLAERIPLRGAEPHDFRPRPCRGVAWRRHDADTYGAQFTQDATYVTFVGTYYQGRRDIIDSHRTLFAKFLKGTQLADEILDVRFYGLDSAVITSRGDS